ncbi:MAG: FtsX-like permease family protein, partial [Gemmatimonadetes bacterium]|nr:FtsX-like permease family protein [Gemmatimonadota bacterium]
MTLGSFSALSSRARKAQRGAGIALPFRLALRGLIRSPGNSALAVGILVLGLAAPVTFFSILTGSLRHLPVPQGHRVVRAEVSSPRTAGGAVPVTLRDLDLIQGASSLDEIGAFRTSQGTLVDPDEAAVRVSVATLTPDVLSLLRTVPALGLVPAEEAASEGLLLGFDVWQEAYGGSPDVLGRAVFLDDEQRMITGVMPEGFGFPFRQNAWAFFPRDRDDPVPVEIVGRLADGASLEAASVELSGLWARGEGLREPVRQGGAVEVDSFTGGRGERGEGVAFLGLVLVALALLMIACANVANLLLVRASDRIRSLGIQASLGAGKAHLSLQLFFEALLLALLGGGGGLLLAWVGIDAIQNALAAEHFGYFWMRMAVDIRVVAFASVLVGGTALFSGTIPILRLLKTDLQVVLKERGDGAVFGGGGRWNLRFVGLQLALSCAALVAAGLTGQSLAKSRDFGADLPSTEILVASVDPLAGTDEAQSGWPGRLGALEEGLAGLAGTRSVALALGAPGYLEPFGPFEVQGREALRDVDRRGVLWNAVTPEYFSVLDLEIISGRGLGTQDGAGAPPVAVVSAGFAGRHLEGEEPLGRRLKVSGADTATLFSIVGVVEDAELGGGSDAIAERVYLSLPQLSSRPVLALLRSETEAASLAPGLRGSVADVDPRIPVWSVRSLADGHAFMTRVPRAMASISLAGGLGGLMVAAVGLYGLLAFRVRQRRR